MERRTASHTEEEEMNQRRRLLNAARKGDSKAINKLFELYQVRVFSGDQLAKVNRTSTYMNPMKLASSKGGRSGSKSTTGGAKARMSASMKPTSKRTAAKGKGMKRKPKGRTRHK